MILSLNGIIAGKGLPPSTLLTNLFAMYKGENNSNDSLGVYNASAIGGLTYTTGISGNAFTFNGNNSSVNAPNNSFNFSSDFSICLWLYLTDSSVNQDLYSNADLVSSVDRGYRVSFRGPTNFIRFSIYGSSLVNLDTTTSIIPLNTWTNIVITRKASTRTRIYINGVLSTSNTSLVNPNYTGTFEPVLGMYKSTTTPSTLNRLSNGSKIDEFALWNKELTQVEVTELQTKYYPF